ncbi:MAG TPA: indole-3-glycerol phosphate synthase TrpC [Pyrinomonadaceae bacterium]|jgi:indole-3-glycerol phosphate synthase|nr:indole-3-glycerol phosphate synthase TrpC [Pyrinomonadaceae bacterium]
MTATPDFLKRIIEQKRVRLARAMSLRPLGEVRSEALRVRSESRPHALRAALEGYTSFNVIAEIKRASPSLGDIRRDASPAGIALRYEAGGAAAISVLTEEDHFRGSLEDLRAVRAVTSLPLLRKDFIVDEWQLYEAAAAHADALLLIVAALEDATLARLRRIAEDELGMDALVEVHTGEELRRAAVCGAGIIGVNNRNLHTFEVSLETSVELIGDAPPGALLVSESGLRTHADLRRLKSLGYRGFLVGETLMRAGDPAGALRALLAGESSAE